MSGTIPLSMTQQMDQYGDPLLGGKLYFFVAGTVSNPITLDATGRVPQLFIADGLIKVRLTDALGVTQLVADNVQVIGPSSGGGGGGATVDPTAVYTTGDLKPRYGIGAHTGWVRLNGNTIGSATSGATERPNADTQPLFQYLWNVDSTLVVSGGRGASSLADWSANKTLALPDWRGHAIGGLDDMGAAAAGRLTAAYFGGVPTQLGASGGGESFTLLTAQMPSHYHTAGISDPGHVHFYLPGEMYGLHPAGIQGFGSGPYVQVQLPQAISSALTGVRLNGVAGLDSTFNTGNDQPHRTIGPRKLCTIYIKL
jgi:microcystin-dependent protein